MAGSVAAIRPPKPKRKHRNVRPAGKAALIAQNVAAGVTAVAGVAANVANAQTGAVRAPKVSAANAANAVSVIHAARANVANVQNAVRVQSVQRKKVPSARIVARDKTAVRARNVASAPSLENRARRANHASRVSPANRVKSAVSVRNSNNARKAMPISSKIFPMAESAEAVKVSDAVAAVAATGVNAESVLSAVMRASRSKTRSWALPRKPITANAYL